MNSQEKEQVVADIHTRFANAASAVVVDYQGCSCEELTGLRNGLRSSGAQFSVVKNTLAKLALKGTEAEGLADVFVGPTAVIWSAEDPVAPAKAISDFAKSKEAFSVKGGVIDGQVVDAAGVAMLASMPSKEEVLAKLLALINTPATRLLQTMNEPASSLVRVLDSWRSKLEEK